MTDGVIETRVAKIWLGEDGILRNAFLPQVEVTEEDAIEVGVANNKAARGDRVPLLVDSRLVKSATRGARTYGARSGVAETRSAVAILVNSPLSRAIGNIFMMVNRPPYPTRLFLSEDLAVAWLKGFLV